MFISDDLRRTERLARAYGSNFQCPVHDLYDDGTPAGVPDVIVCDVAQLTSDAIVRLQRVLASSRHAGTPFLLLIHGNAARAEAQARLLGASDILAADSASRLLQERVDRFQDAAGSAIASRLAEEARQFFVQNLFSGQTITPECASIGTELIARAVRQTGIRYWIRAVQNFDEATHQHCLLVTGLAASFASKLGFSDFDSYRLTNAALLHDVGKIRISPTLLNKPGPLTDNEMAVMRTHAALGFDMLADSGFSHQILQVVRSHHEMLDGSGYPDRLKSNEIPDLVRLVTICDIYGALIERRPYRPAMAGGQAYSIVQSMAGRLDVALVGAFHPVTAAFDPDAAAAA